MSKLEKAFAREEFRVTDAVHAKAILAVEGLPFVSASDVLIAGQPTPRPLTVEEIHEYIQMVHAANGYFLDQFLHDTTNIPTDAYGGSIENRTRLPLGMTEGVFKAGGQKKTGFRISLGGTYNEPRVDGTESVDVVKDGYSNDFIRAIWGDLRLIGGGGYTREIALAAAEEKGDLVAFARQYIANPDLPFFLLHDIALAVGNRATPVESRAYSPSLVLVTACSDVWILLGL
ncbi:NADH:flavin oxidoreductase/NADH oxidase [Mycena venus]|uniref:NADH:flavin oxidoreductase/NADH oxidase n=1 Tax=Mycena venus TaxID=2733690 RepID=A0A8H6WS97_9AGAR|nr:NADH:flavin oxidoreductase/NADH oxidase [Mycena venus]